jgi:TonB family protein
MICLPAYAQDSTSAAAPAATPAAVPAKEAPAAVLPSDPKELMLLAAKTNGLTGSDMHPWHLKATLIALDEDGTATGQVSYEEFWAGIHKYKIAYTGAGIAQTDYGTETGLFRSGASNSLSVLYSEAGSVFIDPFVNYRNAMEHYIVEREERDKDEMKLDCLEVNGFSTPTGMRAFPGPVFCLDADKLIKRGTVNTKNFTQWVRSDIQSYQGHYLPGNIQGSRNGKQILKAHLDSIEDLKEINEADFTPPAEATEVARKITISAGVAQSLLVKSSPPTYPIGAKMAGISGTVVLQARIGLDGRLYNLHTVSGPAVLQEAAIDAVRTWRYKPYILNSEPVEVNTTINIIFTLDR